MKIDEIRCRSILTRASGYLKPVCSHSLNPYVGCGYGNTACGTGCYVQFNHWLTRSRTWGAFLEVKMNAAEVYRATVEKEKRWVHRQGRPFAIFLSSSTEPWQPAETRYRITRGLLDAMQDHPPDELILQTHGTGMRDDLECVQRLSQKCHVRVHISLEGDRDRLPGLPAPAASVEDRLQLIREVSAIGLRAVACLSPLWPLEDPDSFFRSIAESGAQAVVIDHFIGGDGTADGARTFKTGLPKIMAQASADSIELTYRDRIAKIAGNYLPVGLSAEGFAGRYVKGGNDALAASC